MLRHAEVLQRIGDLDWNELMVTANVTAEGSVSPGTSARDGACDVEDQSNWGDPQRPGDGVCTNHFALVHAPGDLTIDGGRGQGLLLVEGDLTIRGGFDFAGIVMVRGALHGNGARITGALTVGAADSSSMSVFHDVIVRFSRCAVHAAMLGTALPVPIAERSWFEAVDGQ
jgi:hypothetical protein